MADQLQAISWALNNSDKSELSIKKLTWINEIFSGWTDIHCELKINGKVLIGRGAADSDDLALCKALAEALERGAFSDSIFRTSNGFAAHLEQKYADINASLELKERDYFLCHYLTRTPFLEIDPWINKSEIKKAIRSWASHYCINVRFFSLSKNGILCTITGFNAGKPFGMTSGTAIRLNRSDAATAALVEAARPAIKFLKSRSLNQSISVREFNKKRNHSFSDHGQLALNLEYAKSINLLFPPVSEASMPSTNSLQTKEIDDKDIKVEVIDWKPESWSKGPFVFSRAFSKKAQELWTGTTKKEFINFKRLEDFSGKRFAWKNINSLPHPFD